MSRCISRHGEFGSHDLDDEYTCRLCGVLDEDALCQELRRLRTELADLKSRRVVSVVFAHHKDAPRPFALYRKTDVSGISGTGVVAEGVAFSDGTAVLRWLSEWPTSVVFHDRGVEAIEKIHGHGGATELVWLSEDLGTLADVETAEGVRIRAVVAEEIASAIEAYVPIAHPVVCPPEIAYQAAQEKAAAIAREHATEATS